MSKPKTQSVISVTTVLAGMGLLLDVRDSVQMISEALPWLAPFLPILAFAMIGGGSFWLLLTVAPMLATGYGALQHHLRRCTKRGRFVALLEETVYLRERLADAYDVPAPAATNHAHEVLSRLHRLYSQLDALAIDCPDVADAGGLFEDQDINRPHLYFLTQIETFMLVDDYPGAWLAFPKGLRRAFPPVRKK